MAAALPYIALAASAAAGVMAAKEQRRAGIFAEKQAEIDVKAEGDAAREREIDRKRGLLRAIASQQAMAAAAGISTSEGAVARIVQLDNAQSARDLYVDTANTRARQSALRTQGRVARMQGANAATMTLLDTAAKAYAGFPGGK
jgi:hypothetical protein